MPDMVRVSTSASRRDVIAYIKTFSSRFWPPEPQDAIVNSADPGYS